MHSTCRVLCINSCGIIGKKRLYRLTLQDDCYIIHLDLDPCLLVLVHSVQHHVLSMHTSIMRHKTHRTDILPRWGKPRPIHNKIALVRRYAVEIQSVWTYLCYHRPHGLLLRFCRLLVLCSVLLLPRPKGYQVLANTLSLDQGLAFDNCNTSPVKSYRTSPNITLLQLPKSITLWTRLVYLAQSNVHEIITVDEMSVERLAIFEFN